MAKMYINVKLTEPETRRYADMNGVLQDLRYVSTVCRRALHLMDDARFILADVEPLHVAAIVRYGRCFKTGRRDYFRIPKDWLDALPVALRRAHADAIAIRDKHIAHSANDWELNAAMAQLVIDQETKQAALTGINPSHSRVVTLSSLQVEALRDLADALSHQVDGEMKKEAAALLELAKRIPIEDLRRRISGPPDIPGRRHPSKERPR